MEFESEILPAGNPDSSQKQHALAAAEFSRTVNPRWPSEAESSPPTTTELPANLAEAGKLVKDA
jgi:hypothetical protein